MKYEIFYKYDGPTPSNPLLEKKTAEEVERALTEMPGEFQYNLETDDEVTVTSRDIQNGRIHIEIKSSLSAAEIEARLKIRLGDWGLYGRELA